MKLKYSNVEIRAKLQKNYMIQIIKDFLSRQIVQTWDTFVHVAFHGKGLTGACLAISKARYFGPLECAFNQWPNRVLINLFVGSFLVKGKVEIEGGLFNIFGEVYFLSVIV